jgi:hypothetical protein
VLQEETEFNVMRILQENSDLTQRELTEKLGISVGRGQLLLESADGKRSGEDEKLRQLQK